jgi:hypothetical protein
MRTANERSSSLRTLRLTDFAALCLLWHSAASETTGGFPTFQSVEIPSVTGTNWEHRVWFPLRPNSLKKTGRPSPKLTRMTYGEGWCQGGSRGWGRVERSPGRLRRDPESRFPSDA